ncbi:MAG: hypothetical protein AAFN74_21555, partial [Myxococcota bacterium]
LERSPMHCKHRRRGWKISPERLSSNTGHLAAKVNSPRALRSPTAGLRPLRGRYLRPFELK